MSEGSQVSEVTLCVEILKWQSPTPTKTKVRYRAARAAKNGLVSNVPKCKPPIHQTIDDDDDNDGNDDDAEWRIALQCECQRIFLTSMEFEMPSSSS